jgi:hypothetical protein
VSDLGKRDHGLGTAVRAWEYFVAECERGYQYSIYDFDNEISCRDRIEAMLANTAEGDADEFHELRRRVKAADQRFRRLALDDQFRRGGEGLWWRRVIVNRAGQELASDLHSQYGVSVNVVAGGPKLP